MGKGKSRKPNSKGSSGINRKLGEAYLEKNANKEGVDVRGSGLQYEVLEKGDGGFVPYGSTLTVNHKISLCDGAVITDTYKSGKPDTFALKDAIKGYHEGLLLMNIGDRYLFAIPHELAWQKRGSNEVPPHSTIIIDCTVLSAE